MVDRFDAFVSLAGSPPKGSSREGKRKMRQPLSCSFLTRIASESPLFCWPLHRTRKWKKELKEFEVPFLAREAIVTIGMFGGTGTAKFDGIKLEVVRSSN